MCVDGLIVDVDVCVAMGRGGIGGGGWHHKQARPPRDHSNGSGRDGSPSYFLWPFFAVFLVYFLLKSGVSCDSFYFFCRLHRKDALFLSSSRLNRRDTGYVIYASTGVSTPVLCNHRTRPRKPLLCFSISSRSCSWLYFFGRVTSHFRLKEGSHVRPTVYTYP